MNIVKEVFVFLFMILCFPFWLFMRFFIEENNYSISLRDFSTINDTRHLIAIWFWSVPVFITIIILDYFKIISLR